MWIALTILITMISGMFGFLLGWAFALRFKTFYNYINYLRGCEKYTSVIREGRTDVLIYGKSIHEARAIARMHESMITDA